MAPVLFAKIPFFKNWNTPIDFGLRVGKHRLFGDHKTIRGLVTGIIFGSLFSIFQRFLESNTLTYPQNLKTAMILGFTLSFGALFGDMAKSFLKRQIGKKSGQSWFPFDQLDYIVGALIFSFPIVRWPGNSVVSITAVYFCLHLAITFLGYKLKFKKNAI